MANLHSWSNNDYKLHKPPLPFSPANPVPRTTRAGSNFVKYKALMDTRKFHYTHPRWRERERASFPIYAEQTQKIVHSNWL